MEDIVDIRWRQPTGDDVQNLLETAYCHLKEVVDRSDEIYGVAFAVPTGSVLASCDSPAFRKAAEKLRRRWISWYRQSLLRGQGSMTPAKFPHPDPGVLCNLSRKELKRRRYFDFLVLFKGVCVYEGNVLDLRPESVIDETLVGSGGTQRGE